MFDIKETSSVVYLTCKNATIPNNSKIACFDLDHTIIKPTNGKIFSNSDIDWILFDKCVITKLKEYHDQKYSIVIVSNQKALKNNAKKLIWISKVKKLCILLNLPITIIASTKDDCYRKPRMKIWYEYINGNNESFYCGDAGGLPKRKIGKNIISKDFSDTDLKFAHNIGIQFVHRDEFIYGKVWNNIKITYPFDFNTIPIVKRKKHKFIKKDMIINIGFPGSGKSYYSKHFISSKYVYINRDQLKTLNKCIKLCKEAVNDNKSIIIDNTNPSIETRKQFIDIAKVNNYNIRCFHFTTSRYISYHNNIYRSMQTNDKIVPNIAYNIFQSKFVKPLLSEGFNEVIDIDFELDEEKDNDLYFKYFF